MSISKQELLLRKYLDNSISKKELKELLQLAKIQKFRRVAIGVEKKLLGCSEGKKKQLILLIGIAGLRL